MREQMTLSLLCMLHREFIFHPGPPYVHFFLSSNLFPPEAGLTPSQCSSGEWGNGQA